MNTVTVPVEAAGALVEIAVSLSFPDAQALRQAGKPLPTPVSVLALIDTGAEVTAVDPDALKSLITLGIRPTRFVFVNLAGASAQPVAEYAVSLTINSPQGRQQPLLVSRNQPVVAQDLAVLGYQAVLGRDLLARCLLVYDGPGGVVTLGA